MRTIDMGLHIAQSITFARYHFRAYKLSSVSGITHVAHLQRVSQKETTEMKTVFCDDALSFTFQLCICIVY